jgi:signal recognition particle subunit SRP54
VFETLTDKLSQTFSRLKGRGRLSEADIDEALKEVRIALLEADVNFKVVKEFSARVADRAKGQEVVGSLTPAQLVVKIVHEELVGILGSENAPLARVKQAPGALVVVGLQGAGKTTTVGKLALMLTGQGHRVMLVACDVHRPAAVDQLVTVGGQAGVPVETPQPGEALPHLAMRALTRARIDGFSHVIFDTAGRLHIDKELMDEVAGLVRLVNPVETLLVADAMTGQDAVAMATGFAAAVPLTGIILTKFDGDARGGAALSMRQVVGVPIKFVGTGEKLNAIEPFHPGRLASRILGMGDVLSLIERAQDAVDRDAAKAMEQRIRKNKFTLADFRENLKMVGKMGSMEELLGMIPGLGRMARQQDLKVDEREFVRLGAIIDSMTPAERANHKIISQSRRRRIARGSGTDLQDVNRLIKQFEKTQLMMKRLSKMGALAGTLKGRRSLPQFLLGGR